MGLFSRFKKSKTLRSVLGAAALFTAGAPTVAEAAPKAPQKITQNVTVSLSNLSSSCEPLMRHTEGNYPYCYYGKTGSMTVGCGVHLKDFSALKKLSVLKITPKKDCSFSLEQKERLMKMADADWNLASTKTKFPEVAKVERISVEDCAGECPKNTDKKWVKELFLMPTKTLEKINKAAIDFYVQKAYQYHPNLLDLPPSARLVVVDLMYNLGYNKYLNTYLEFQKAVKNCDLKKMKKECGSSNARRDAIREYLMDSALLVKEKGKLLSAEQLCRLHRLSATKKKNSLSPNREPDLWKEVMASCIIVNKIWNDKQFASVKYAKRDKKYL